MNYETSIASDTDLLDPEGAASSRRKRNLIIAIVLLTAAAMAAAYFFFGGTSTEEEAAAAADKLGQAQTVSVVAPGRETVARAISATGTLAARREIPVGVVGEGGQVS